MDTSDEPRDCESAAQSASGGDDSASPASGPTRADDTTNTTSPTDAADVAPAADDVSDPTPMSFGPTPTEIVFSFDTTGSMSSCLEEVQNHLKTIINRLFMDIPALRIALIAHGDYCDSEHFYVIKSLDFTNDVSALLDFVSQCGGTGGGDYEECYELVLRKVRESLSWMPSTTKSLVMIGDAVPHPPGHGGNDDQIDWRDEVDRLHGELGVRIYAVQCMVDYNKQATGFWQELSKRSFGKYLEMNKFGTVIDLMMAICYKEGGNPALFEAYEREVRRREGPRLGKDLDRMFSTLRDGPATSSSSPVAMIRPLIAIGVAAKKKKKASTKRADATPGPRPSTKKKQVASPRGDPGTTKKKKQPKTKKKRSKSTKAARSSAAGKINRETVASSKFVLKNWRWSQWAFYKKGSPLGVVAGRKPFPKADNRAMIYELSVQARERCKRYVVHFAITSGKKGNNQWTSVMFRAKGLREQLAEVLDQQARVYIRRAALPKVLRHKGKKYSGPRQFSALLRSKYCYAWSKASKDDTGAKSRGRSLTRKGYVISRVVSL